MTDKLDDLAILDFLIISQERRKRAWKNFMPKPSYATANIERWRQYEVQRQQEQGRKTQERVDRLRTEKGLEPFYR